MSARSAATANDRWTGIRWGVATITVLAAHAAGAWIVTQRPLEASTGKAVAAIMVELEPLPVAPAAEPTDVAPAPEVSEVQPEPEAEAPEPKPDMPPLPEPARPNFEAAELQSLSPRAPEPEVVLPEQLKKSPVTDPHRPEVKKKPVPRPRQQRKQTRPQNRVATAPPRAQDAATPAAPALGSVSSSTASPANWRGALIAHLNRAKRYPLEARQRREEGMVRLNFSIDRSGRVVGYRIVESSGSAALDQEALAMIQRASPLPAPPPEIGGTRISLTVPLRFNVN